MKRGSLRSPLAVSMNGIRVGTLTRGSGGALAFVYDPTWIETPRCRPISLSLPLSSAPYSGSEVANYFDNLLPDRSELRERLRSKFGARSAQVFDLLGCIGADCIGALQFHEVDRVLEVRCIDAIPISNDEIGKRLKNHRDFPLGMAGPDEDFRISVAGSQKKTALLWHEGAWHLPRGTTPTSHIFKLPIGLTPDGVDLSDSTENEWLCGTIARAFGLSVARSERHDFGGRRVLVVERFDRKWASDRSWLMRLPQEDLCQAMGIAGSDKYEADGGPGIASILELLRQSNRAEEDRRDFFKACFLYWLLAGIDGHGKNFGVFLDGDGRFHSTPLYDIVSAHPYLVRGSLPAPKVKMAMAVRGKNRHYLWAEIAKRHWLSTARHARFPVDEAEGILQETLAAVPDVITRVRSELPSDFPAETADPILAGIESTARRS
jgi:serine/threonine-protein kinase HipA